MSAPRKACDIVHYYISAEVVIFVCFPCPRDKLVRWLPYPIPQQNKFFSTCTTTALKCYMCTTRYGGIYFFTFDAMLSKLWPPWQMNNPIISHILKLLNSQFSGFCFLICFQKVFFFNNLYNSWKMGWVWNHKLHYCWNLSLVYV